MTICFATTTFSQETTAKTKMQNKGPVVYQKISRTALATYSFIEEDGTTDVTEFKVHIQGQPTLQVKGPTMNQKVIQAIQKADKKTRVVIFDIVRNGVSSKEGAIIFSLEN